MHLILFEFFHLSLVLPVSALFLLHYQGRSMIRFTHNTLSPVFDHSLLHSAFHLRQTSDHVIQASSRIVMLQPFVRGIFGPIKTCVQEEVHCLVKTHWDRKLTRMWVGLCLVVHVNSVDVFKATIPVDQNAVPFYSFQFLMSGVIYINCFIGNFFCFWLLY